MEKERERIVKTAPLCVDRVSVKSEELQWVLLRRKRNVDRNDGNSTGR